MPPQITTKEENFLQFLKTLDQNESVQNTEIVKPIQSTDTVSLTLDESSDTLPQEDEESVLDTEEVGEDINELIIIAPKESSITLSNIFTNSSIHPIIYDLILFRKYEAEWLIWEPDVLWKEIQEDFKHPSISNLAKAKIQAVRTCHIVETPWKAWEVFVHICHALNNKLPDMQTLVPPTVSELLICVDIMNILNNEETFNEEVQRFIAACFLNDHVWYLPKPVDFAQEYTAVPRYICKQCGRVDTDDSNNMCDFCGAPQSDLVKMLTRDYFPVKHRLDTCLELGKMRSTLEENIIDIQVAKLLIALKKLDISKNILKQQAEVLDVQL